MTRTNSNLRYLELKSGCNDSGPAWIGYVQTSKSGRTIYFNNHAFQSTDGRGISANYYDVETGEQYWISGVKKNGTDRHWAGSGIVLIEAAAVEEYLVAIGSTKLDLTRLKVTHGIVPTDVSRFHRLANESYKLAQP